MSVHGVGIDVGSVSRAATLIERYGEHFIGRWFDESELGEGHFCATRVASGFSVKEAVWKALRIDEHSPLPWRQIIVTHAAHGNGLTVRLDGELAITAAAMGIGPLRVSATVSGDLTVAVAIAEKAGT